MKTVELPGILGALAAKFGVEPLAEILWSSARDLVLMAENYLEVESWQAETLGYLCLLHGIRPGLYVYSAWADHKDVVIQNCAGWTATSLLNPRWGREAPHWQGNPADLKAADAETLARARALGWPW